MLCEVSAGVEGGVGVCGFEVGGEEGEGFGGGDGNAGVVDGGWVGGGHCFFFFVFSGGGSGDGQCQAKSGSASHDDGGKVERLWLNEK